MAQSHVLQLLVSILPSNLWIAPHNLAKNESDDVPTLYKNGMKLQDVTLS